MMHLAALIEEHLEHPLILQEPNCGAPCFSNAHLEHNPGLGQGIVRTSLIRSLATNLSGRGNPLDKVVLHDLIVAVLAWIPDIMETSEGQHLHDYGRAA